MELTSNQYSMPLSKLISQHTSLVPVYLPQDPANVLITSHELNRPGLELNGFFRHFDNSRIQVIGNNERAFVEEYSPEKREECLDILSCSTCGE